MSSKPAALPASLLANPRLSQWLSINADGSVTFSSGKVELGQGIDTALAQIVAEGLDVSLSRVRRAVTSTATGPNEGMTSGSLSVQESGSALRLVCAQAREIYLRSALVHLGLPQTDMDRLYVVDGIVHVRASAHHPLDCGPTSYWALADSNLLNCDASGLVVPAVNRSHLLVGQSVQRQAIKTLVKGQAHFIHDMVLPDMVYGRMAHPPSPGAVLGDLDLATVQAMPGVVKVVRDGNFLGVVARTEFLALRALAQLVEIATWTEIANLPVLGAPGQHSDLGGYLRAQPHETSLIGERRGEVQVTLDVTATTPGDSNFESVGMGSAGAATQKFQASYSRPFLAHASIGPSCALARYQPGRLEVWTHSQGIYHLRADLATVFALSSDHIVVQHVPGAGCYGHNGADDVACDAALLARAVPGQAVQVVWSRADELACGPLGAAMAVDLTAQISVDGVVVDWQHVVWSTGHSMRPGRSAVPVLLAASLLEKPFAPQIAVNAPMAAGGGAERNASPFYDFVNWRAVNHRLLTMPLRTSALRSLGAHCNVFALESFLDEITTQLQVDPLAFRLRNLSDSRARAALVAVTEMAGWAKRPKPQSDPSSGFGLAFARYKNTGAYCAVVACVDASGHAVRVKKLWIAVDVGLVINPDGVANQIEGGAIQTVSWVLKEAVQFDSTRILSSDWDSYPILRFSEVPDVQVQIINQPDQKSLGAGEATHGPVAAAIGNALADALGVRVRDMPMTPEKIQRAASAS